MLTPQETQAAHAFWKWFEENRLPFEFFLNMDDEQRAELLEKSQAPLEAYSEGLQLQPGGNISAIEGAPKHRLVITTGGEIRYFAKAKALAALAPELPDWAVYGLLPPMSQKVEVRFQLPIGVLYPGDVWIHLLENPNDPSFLGLHLALKLYDHCPDEDARQQLQSMLIQLVAYVLGEESWAMNIQHLQLGPLPPDPMEEGMIVLYDLPEAVADFRKEQPGPNWEKQVMGEDE